MRKISSLLLLAWLALAGIMSAQDLPFTPTTISGGKFVGRTQYYYIILSERNKYLYIDGNDVKWTDTKDAAAQFAITGNTSEGFKIYKKGDTSKLIYVQNTTTSSVDNVYYGASETNNSWTLFNETGKNNAFYQTGPCVITTASGPSTPPCTLNFHEGSTSVWTWSHSNAPGSADCKVAFEVGDVEPADLVSFTYQFNLNGVTSTKVVSAEVGADFPALDLPAFCEATKPEGTISAEDDGTTKEISVNWNGPFKYTSSVEGAKWYLMTLGKADNGNLPVVRYNPSNNWITLEQGDNTFTYAKNDQWAFVGNPFDGFKIYNRALENGRLISSTTMSGTAGQNTFPYVSADVLQSGFTDTWDIYMQTTGGTQTEIEGGFAIGQHGTPANKINRRWQKSTPTYVVSDYRMAYWTGGADNGSTFTVSQTSLPDINLNTVDGTSYASFYVDYPVKVESADVKVYTGTIHGGRLDMEEANDKIIPENVGVVLISETTTTAELSISNEAGTLEAGSLTGTTTERDITGSQSNYLVLGRATDEPRTVGFYQPNPTTITRIPANRAYIYLAGGSVQGLAFNFDGETTGINNISTSTNEQGIYDLSGRRVMKANKGLYIINGKKCFIK